MAHKDLVEIRPVCLDGGREIPVADRAVERALCVDVRGPGDLCVIPNPAHVPGAYTALHHIDAHGALARAGLAFGPGVRHTLPLEAARTLMRNSADSPSFRAALHAALRAGDAAGASHISLRDYPADTSAAKSCV